MRFSQQLAWGLALAAVAAGSPARAAWNNVFQVCCNSCGGAPAPAVASYGDPGCAPACAPACPAPCPPPPTTTCTTRYVQRSYYQPVTTYKTTTYYQPVTTYRTSYYYQPVTSYRYSCYYDPCTCRYQSVAQPVTSYCLKSQCCPVTSYLQRTCMTPVTAYQQSFYYEPVTSCCTTSSGGPAAAPVPATTGAVAPPPPVANETREPASAAPLPPPPPGTAPVTSETRDAGTSSEKRNPDRSAPFMPPATEGSRRVPARLPAVHFDRIASRGASNIEGRVVDATRAPRSGVRVLLVSVDSRSQQQTLTAGTDGAFRTQVVSGGWLVYTYDSHGRPVFSRRVEVPADRSVSMTLVQR